MKLQGGRGGGGPGGGGGRPPGKPLIGNGGLGTDPGGGGIEPGGGLRGYRTVDAAVWRRRSDDSNGDGRADGWTPSPPRTARRWRAAGVEVRSWTPLTHRGLAVELDAHARPRALAVAGAARHFRVLRAFGEAVQGLLRVELGGGARAARPDDEPQRRERAAADQKRAEAPIANSSHGHRVVDGVGAHGALCRVQGAGVRVASQGWVRRLRLDRNGTSTACEGLVVRTPRV